MATDYLESLENLDNLSAEVAAVDEANRNEATMRLQFIDRLLFECLGWDKWDCVNEDNHEGTYTDYSLGKPYVTLIVEAKKEDVYFSIPAGFDGPIYPLERFRKEAPDVFKAVEQAMVYCQTRGVPFGAVCNGHQIVAFLASRTDSIAPMKGQALVLPSLVHMRDGFRDLWDCLSHPGVSARGLASRLQDIGDRPPPDKLSVRIHNYPRHQVRNELQSNLQIFGDLIIEDVGKLPPNEKEFLTACYADSGALSQYALISKSILQTRYSAAFQESLSGPLLSPATEKGGKSVITAEMLAQSATRRPILLIGDVGVGKTMFVRHFINVEAADILKDAIILYLDLGVKPTLEAELDDYLQEEISRQLYQLYSIDITDRNFVQGVYNVDLQSFDKGIYGSLREFNRQEYELKKIVLLESKINNTQEHLKRCLEHIHKGRKQQIVIFLDNVDQRTDDFQQKAFLIGQSMAELWPAMVFVSLRPETFHKSKAGGALSAYHVKAFTISPPRVDRVIQKRLQYAINLLELGQIGQSIEGVGMLVNLDDLSDFLSVTKMSFEKNVELIEFVDNVCGGNIRLALDFIRVFVGSGHVDTGKILGIYRDSGTYTVPLHEFLRAVIYGDQRDYDARASAITNLFDIRSPDGREHFLGPIALALIGLEARPAANSGYVDPEEIYAYAQSLGFQPAQIAGVLEKLLAQKLVETENKDFVGERFDFRPRRFRITTIGSYYYQKLIGKFTYVDAVVVDTPIVAREWQDKISDVANINERLARAEAFRKYLDSQWVNLENTSDVFNWRPMSSMLFNEIELIKLRVDRNAGLNESAADRPMV